MNIMFGIFLFFFFLFGLCIVIDVDRIASSLERSESKSKRK